MEDFNKNKNNRMSERKTKLSKLVFALYLSCVAIAYSQDIGVTENSEKNIRTLSETIIMRHIYHGILKIKDKYSELRNFGEEHF